MRWIKTFFINSFLILSSIVVTLFVLDVVLHYTPLKWKYMYPLNTDTEYFRFDPTLGYDIIPNSATNTHSFSDFSYPIWSNNLGCFDGPFDGKKPYIYLAGDSFTWGYTPQSEKWGKVLERGLGMQTLNCGVPGFGTRQEAIKAQHTIAKLPQPPKLIILAHFEDDAGDDFNFPAYTAYRGYVIPAWYSCDTKFLSSNSPFTATTTCNLPTQNYTFLQKVKIELAAHSVLYMMAKRQFGIQDMLKHALLSVAPGLAKQSGLTHDNAARFDDRTTNLSNSLYWDVHFANLAAFKTYAEQSNSKLLVVLIPVKEMVTATSTDPTWTNERTKTYLEHSGIPYIDLLPTLRTIDPTGEVLYWHQDIHWTPAGNAVVGKVIQEYVEKNHLLQ